MRTVGTVSRGVRCPVVKQGDDMVRIVTDAIVSMGREEHSPSSAATVYLSALRV